jgi:hypothetical protein
MKKQLLMLTAFLKGRVVVLLRERSRTENWSKNIGHN